MMDNDTYNEVKKEIMDEIIGAERHSINTVGIIKQKQDEEDPLHIFKLNDKKLNGKPSFVFKSSTPMACIALLMDQNNKVKTPFQGAVAFVDGLHSKSCRLHNTNALGPQSCDLAFTMHCLHGM